MHACGDRERRESGGSVPRARDASGQAGALQPVATAAARGRSGKNERLAPGTPIARFDWKAVQVSHSRPTDSYGTPAAGTRKSTECNRSTAQPAALQCLVDTDIVSQVVE